AADLVRRDDSEKSGRMKYLYEVDLADPMLYDLTLSTERLGYEASVDMIETLIKRPELATTDVARRTGASRALAPRLPVPLAINADRGRSGIWVEAEDGAVPLEGTGALERAVEVARDVPGVRVVTTRQLEVPPIPPFVA